MEKVQLKIWVEPMLADTFKALCASEGISVTREISGLMSRRMGSSIATHTPRIATRGDRRKAMSKAIALLSSICDAETQYMENIPENLQGSATCEAAAETVDAIEQAIAILEDAF